MTLIVVVFGGAGVVPLEQLHHLHAASLINRTSSYDLSEQPCSCIGRQLVPVFAVRPARYFLASVRIFAERFLVDIDICVAQRRIISIDGVALALQHIPSLTVQLKATSGEL